MTETIPGVSRTAQRTHGFTESVIRGMTRIANESGAINLSQGFPNFPAPDVLKTAAAEAIHADINQYAVTWGAPRLRQALAAKYREWYDLAIDPDRHLTVCCGATEAMVSAIGFAKLHVFPFSPREGTEAAAMGGAVDGGARKQRAARLRELGRQGRRRFISGQLGQPARVLVEHDGTGLSTNYIRIRTPGAAEGSIVDTRIEPEQVADRF